MPERRRPCLQAGGRPRDRALRRGSLEEALAAPGGCAATVPARLTTQVEIILGDKSPTAVHNVRAKETRGSLIGRVAAAWAHDG